MSEGGEKKMWLNCCGNEKNVVTLRPLCVASGEE